MAAPQDTPDRDAPAKAAKDDTAERTMDSSPGRILLLKSKSAHLSGPENFLKNRKWRVQSLLTTKEVLMAVMEAPPNYAVLCADHPNRQVRTLPALLKEKLGVHVIAYFDKMTNNSTSIVEQMGVDYVLFPPVSGPAIERMILKIQRDIRLQQEQEAAQAGGVKDGAPAAPGSDLISVKQRTKQAGRETTETKRQSAMADIQRMLKLEDKKDGDETDDLIYTKRNLGDQKEASEGELVNSSSRGESESENDEDGNSIVSPGGSRGNTASGAADSVNQDLDSGAGGRKTAEASGAAGATKAGAANAGATNAKDAANAGVADGSAANSGSEAADGDSANRQNSRRGRGDRGDRGTENPTPMARKGRERPSDLADETADKNQAQAPRSKLAVGIDFDGDEDESASPSRSDEISPATGASPAASEAKATPASAVLSEAVDFALARTSGNFSYSPHNEAVDGTRATCVVIDSKLSSGYLVISSATNRSLGESFLNLFRDRVVDYFSEKHEPLISHPNLSIVLQSVDFDHWARSNADFVKKSMRKHDSIMVAYFPFAEIHISTGVPLKEGLSAVSITDLHGDEKLDFNLYIYLPRNNRFVHYTRDNFVFYTHQKDRLSQLGVDYLHVPDTETENLKKYRARTYLNSRIQSFQTSDRKKS